MRPLGVTTISLRYVREVRGRLYWEPSAEMRAHGFEPMALGPNGPEAQAKGLALYQSWLKAKAGEETKPAKVYPAGSLGAYYQLLRANKRFWRRRSVRTAEDYDRSWPRIEPHLGDKTITKITVHDCEDLLEHLEKTVSDTERYRTMKVLRKLLADAILRLRLNMASPALGVKNPQPAGRSAIWLGAEIPKLIAAAETEEVNQPGMAVAIRIAWDTLFSPVDIWNASYAHLKRDAGGWYLHRPRTKTAKEAFGALSNDTVKALLDYLDGLGLELTPGARLIRRPSRRAYTSKNYFAQDFRAVREAAFPGDKRQFQDLRRSGNVEADAAGADKETMGEILANNIASSAFLDDTYTPPTVAKARQVQELRQQGRERLQHELERVRASSKYAS